MAERDIPWISNLTVDALELRLLNEGLAEGVFDNSYMKCTINGATIDVAAGSGIVQGDHSTIQGKYRIINDAVKNSANFEGGGIPANPPAGQGVVHQIVAKIWDPDFEAVGGSGSRWRLMIAPGVPSAGALTAATALDAMTGAADLTTGAWRSSMLLAALHVSPAGVLTLRDRRAWAGGVPKVVAALPADPLDGQIVHFIADAGQGIIWPLRYRTPASTSSPYRWESMGLGTPLGESIGTAETRNNSAYGDLATVGPSVTVPLAGDYLVAVCARGFSASNQDAYMAYQVGASGITDDWAAAVAQFPSAQTTGHKESRWNNAPAGALFRAKYRTGGAGVSTFSSRWMTVSPIRVG